MAMVLNFVRKALYIFVIVLGLILVVRLFFGVGGVKHFSLLVSNQPPKNNLVAELGGMRVEIPYFFARYFEFNGDPGWGEKKSFFSKKSEGLRKLRSFGFDVRYPDMAGLSSPEMERDKSKTTIFKTMWISVGVNTGEIYPGDGFLDRIVNRVLNVDEHTSKFRIYEKLPFWNYGLTLYAPAGIDPETKKPYRLHDFAEDIFIYRDDSGKVITYIKCSNTPGKSAPCRQVFELQGAANAKIYFSYRRDLLPEWKEMQGSIGKLILSFEAK